MFKVRDKVVCIDDSPGFNNQRIVLKKDNIYTISCVESPRADANGTMSTPVMLEGIFGRFSSVRFRKVEEDFGEQVLSKIKEQIKEDELQLV